MTMFTLSAFADEISPDPQLQVDVLSRSGVRHIELRSIHKTNVLDLTDAQIQDFKSLLDRHRFKLSAIGSPIGKVKIDTPFELHLQRFHRAIELCKVFGTPNIRVFSYYPPVFNPCGLFAESIRCFGLQACTDGSSNTIAYGEALVGSEQRPNVKWRSGPVLPAASALCGTPWCGVLDVSTNFAGVMADLQACEIGYANQPNQGPGSVNQKGFRWCENLAGFSLFNTVVPPSPGDYRFGWCALRGGGINSNASDGQYQNANSNHPGGSNFLFGDGSARFLKSSIAVRTYWALGSRNLGEVVSSDQY
jgi:prepilin-type processing-associated H-X9-DG protein